MIVFADCVILEPNQIYKKMKTNVLTMIQRLVVLGAVVVMAASCGSAARVVNTATYSNGGAAFIVTPVQADLKVSPKKVTYTYQVPSEIRVGGEANVVATAVKEALAANGNGDVIVGLEKSFKYNSKGEIETLTITGYTATYTNFRNGDLSKLPPAAKQGAGKGFGGFFKK